MPQTSQNLLEQFEPEKLPVGWPWQFFSIALAIFAAVVIGYLGLILGYEPFLKSSIQEKDAQIAQIAEAIPRNELEQFIQFYSRLENLKTLLANHVNASKTFALLEKITHQKVFYKTVFLKVPERELDLEGAADSYVVLAEQLESFDRAGELDRYILSRAQVSDNLVQFRATLKLKDILIK